MDVSAFQLAVAKHADSDVLWTTAGTPDTVPDDEVAGCKHSSSNDLWSCGMRRFDKVTNIVSANLKGINANRSVSATNDLLVLIASAPWLAPVAISVATVAFAVAEPLAAAFGFAFADRPS